MISIIMVYGLGLSIFVGMSFANWLTLSYKLEQNKREYNMHRVIFRTEGK